MQSSLNRHLPLVTLMIPTYGQEDVILAAVDSALAQDYPNLEILVVDDASPDNTAQLIATRDDYRLRYHRNEKNLGRVANYRNALYNLAAGDWVVNLDGDDYYTDTHFISAAMELALTDNSIVIVTAKQRTETPNGSFENEAPAESSLTGCEILLNLPGQRYSFMHLASIYKRSSAVAIDFYRMDVLSSDLESLFRLALDGKVAYLDRVVGVWIKNDKNTSSTDDVDELICNLDIWPSIFSAAIDKGCSPLRTKIVLARTLSYYSYGHLYNYITTNKYKQFIDFMSRLTKKHGLLIAMLSTIELCLKLPYRLLNQK